MGIKMRVFRHLPLDARAWLFEKKLMDRHWPSWYEETYRSVLNQAFDTFLTSEERSDKKLMRELTNDIVKCWFRYQALPYEYFLYDMRHCDDDKRATFLTDVVKDQTCVQYINLEVFNKEVKDKYAFFQIMKPFFGRKVFQVNNLTDRGEFVKFAMDVKSLFCKLSKGSRGNGAFAEEVSSEEDAERLFMRLTTSIDDVWVVEERIHQSEEMAQWNESSVNTVRIPSFITQSGFKVICPAYRTGRKGSVVDNASQGSVLAGIDIVSGTLITDGVDEFGHTFKEHPDSGLVFKGWQIPRWKELLETAEQAHRTIPHHKYIGWDFALTDKGWVLIEGNWGQMIGQYATKVGVKDLFMKYISE
jgi:hypothetical protein